MTQEDSDLIIELIRLSQRRPRPLVSYTQKNLPSLLDFCLQSWNLDVSKHRGAQTSLPTRANSLFSAHDLKASIAAPYRIVVRGYDRFFKVDEVPWTSWSAIEKHTAGPYDLTLCSNGCNINIAAASSTTLIVTSKRSFGPKKVHSDKSSHAEMGEMWLLKQLERVDKSKEDLAHVLYANNWTAVAELCDDSFEEHVISYEPERSGLYLHGLNDSSSIFNTQTPEKVNEFAREWGFFETPFHTEQTVQKAKEFADTICKEGRWNGEPIEGFVVRCSIKGTASTDDDNDDAPPSPPGSPFFFKVKCRQYTLYRNWREITKSLLRDWHLPPSATQQPGSRLYLKWVIREIERDPFQFEHYCENKGIFAARQKFLDWRLSGDDAIDSLEVTFESLQLSVTKSETRAGVQKHQQYNSRRDPNKSYRGYQRPKSGLTTPNQWRYYGFELPGLDLNQVITSTLDSLPGSEPEALSESIINTIISQEKESRQRDSETIRRFWSTLLEKGRVNPQPHVTLVHCGSLGTKNTDIISLWDACASLCIPSSYSSKSLLSYKTSPKQPEWLIKPNTIICDDKVMAIVVDLTYASTRPEQAEQAEDLLSMIPHTFRSRLHITVGTRDVTVGAVEAKALTERWRRSYQRVNSNASGIAAVPVDGITLKGKIAGFV